MCFHRFQIVPVLCERSVRFCEGQSRPLSAGGRGLLPYIQAWDLPFFGVLFFEQKINFGVSFLVKSQVVINFGAPF